MSFTFNYTEDYLTEIRYEFLSADNVASFLASSQLKKIDSIADLCSEISTATTDMRTHISARPNGDVSVSEQQAILSDLKKQYQKYSELTINSNKLIPQKVTVVDEFGDRVFKVSSSTEEYNFPVYIDEEGIEVEEIYSPNSDLISRSGDSPELPSRVETPGGYAATLINKTPQAIASKRGSAKSSINDTISRSEDSLRFEIWSCILLDIAERVNTAWNQLLATIDSLLQSIRNIENMAKGTIFSSPQLLSGLLDYSNLTSAISINIPAGTVTKELLGISGSLVNNVDYGSTSLCGLQADRMCNIKRALESMRVSISRDLDALNYNVNIDIDFAPLQAIIEKLVAIKLEYNNDFLQFNKDICFYINRRMRGVPKKISRIELAVASILSAIDLAKNITVGESPTLNAIVDRLNKNGFDAISNALVDGDFDYFLNGGYTTEAGKLADELYEKSEQEGNARSSARLRLLADAALAQEDRQTASIRIRDAMRFRYASNKKENTMDIIRRESSV